MDRILRAEVVATVRETITDVMECADEVWLTSKGLLENFGMISQEWLDNYGYKLPREYASVIWPDGTEKCTRYAYPKHKINRLIKEGMLKGIFVEKAPRQKVATK